MVKCKLCVKNDVCKKTEEIQRLYNDLRLNPTYQGLSLIAKIDINCPNYKDTERYIYR